MAPTLPQSVPPTHDAVATVAARSPLAIIPQPTEAPGPTEVLIHVLWTASTPLDLHQADGGLLVQHPAVMGSAWAGTVAALGSEANTSPTRAADQRLAVGDAVFGFAFRAPREKAHQTYITTDAFLVSKLPKGLKMEEAVSVPTNLVTVFHAATTDLGLELPWPVEEGWTPPAEKAEAPILVWGAASSVGTYAVQVLRHWGYGNVLAVASGRHHSELLGLGARKCFDYREEGVVEQILTHVGKGGDGSQPRIPYVLDCIGSLEGTLRPLTKIAERGTKVAIMLPVINVHASADTMPEYEMDVKKTHRGLWKEGVELRGVRTHHYMSNEFFKDHLQSEIVPALLEKGIIKPNKLRIVEGKTLLARAEAALALLRNQAPSGEKLVWRVADE